MFSKTCEYAIRAVIYIYNRNRDCKCNVGVEEIANEIQSPRPFTAKILQTLSKQEIISSIKGPNGGFFITEKQAKTSLLELVKAVDGPKLISGCVLGLSQCNENKPCPLHNQYKPIKDEFNQLLASSTIENLASKLGKEHTFLSR